MASSARTYLMTSLTLTLLSLISLSSPLSSDTLIDASDILSDSGFESMALTLELVSQTLTLNASPSLTIFAPADSAFSNSGQPSLSLLRYHFCPFPLSPQTLKSLPAGTKIPTLLPGHMLIVTTSSSSSQISINNVEIASESPIFDVGSLIIFGIPEFFDADFQFHVQRFGPRCRSLPSSSNGAEIGFPGSSWFKEASGGLRSNGYSIMASFLDSQLLGFYKDPTTMTVFAPSDQAMANSQTQGQGQAQDPSVFLRHVVPCKLLWSDLINFSDGTVLPTYLDGFTITITKVSNRLMLNGVPVFFSNLHFSDSIVVHGLNELLVEQETPLEEVEDSKSLSGSGENKVEDALLMDGNEF